MNHAEATSDRTSRCIRQQVYDYIKSCGAHGATDEEVQRALGLRATDQRPRRVELTENYRSVFHNGQMREAESGRREMVWVARAPAGAY